MSPKIRYIASLLALAVFVALATIFVQRQRVKQAETQRIEASIAPIMHLVKNGSQLKQVAMINSHVVRKEAMSDEQVDFLLSIVNGPIDSILQVHTEAVLLDGQDAGCFSPSQRSRIAAKNLVALKHPEVAMQQFAIRLAGKLGEKSSIPALLPFLNSPNPRVQQFTKEALEKLQG